jgi:uncharacterized membrane protein YeaQ/YmgE (transglycosylase-associated protein family)
MQPDTIVSVITWIVTGAIAGYVASLLLRTAKQGCFINVALGIAGAFVGGFVVGRFLFPGGLFGIGILDSIINAIIGSVILLVIIELALPGKQLGVRKESSASTRRRRRR